jgi:hypothetical protein
MSQEISWTLFTIMAAIAALNLYWASGGKWGSSAAVPTLDGEPLIKPSTEGKVVAAALFFGAGMWTLASNYRWLPNWFAVLGLVTMAMLFTLRTVGDVQYFGLFKRVDDSEFAKWDSRLYVPLSFVIAGMSMYLARESISGVW